MIYNNLELSNFPICDTDIWVDAVLADLDNVLIDKYECIVVADVVEKEIMNFKHNVYFRKIADEFERYKNAGQIVVINHSDINSDDRRLLEKQLVDCDNRFVTGLADDPHERHKGEIVSAIYAGHFEIPFLKSNDSTFHEGNIGNLAFPDLTVKNLKDMLNDLVKDKTKRQECFQQIVDNRKFMDEGKRIFEEEKKAPVTENQISLLLAKMRSNIGR